MQPDTSAPRDDESVRLAVPRSYRLDEPAPEAAFAHVVRPAADLFEVPTAPVSFVTDREQVFGACAGFDRFRTARDVIAEGLETADRAAPRPALGCREAQRDLFGRPVPGADCVAPHAGPNARAAA